MDVKVVKSLSNLALLKVNFFKSHLRQKIRSIYLLENKRDPVHSFYKPFLQKQLLIILITMSIHYSIGPASQNSYVLRIGL